MITTLTSAVSSEFVRGGKIVLDATIGSTTPSISNIILKRKRPGQNCFKTCCDVLSSFLDHVFFRNTSRLTANSASKLLWHSQYKTASILHILFLKFATPNTVWGELTCQTGKAMSGPCHLLSLAGCCTSSQTQALHWLLSAQAAYIHKAKTHAHTMLAVASLSWFITKRKGMLAHSHAGHLLLLHDHCKEIVKSSEFRYHSYCTNGTPCTAACYANFWTRQGMHCIWYWAISLALSQASHLIHPGCTPSPPGGQTQTELKPLYHRWLSTPILANDEGDVIPGQEYRDCVRKHWHWLTYILLGGVHAETAFNCLEEHRQILLGVQKANGSQTWVAGFTHRYTYGTCTHGKDIHLDVSNKLHAVHRSQAAHALVALWSKYRCACCWYITYQNSMSQVMWPEHSNTQTHHIVLASNSLQVSSFMKTQASYISKPRACRVVKHNCMLATHPKGITKCSWHMKFCSVISIRWPAVPTVRTSSTAGVATTGHVHSPETAETLSPCNWKTDKGLVVISKQTQATNMATA